MMDLNALSPKDRENLLREWSTHPVTEIVLARARQFQLLAVPPAHLAGTPEVLNQYALQAAQAYGRQEMLAYIEQVLSPATIELSADYGAKHHGSSAV